jgi:hypothetical protein
MDLDANPFFTGLKGFKEVHHALVMPFCALCHGEPNFPISQVYDRAAEERWIICVPHSDSLCQSQLPVSRGFCGANSALFFIFTADT